jgi:hypothetical protein
MKETTKKKNIFFASTDSASAAASAACSETDVFIIFRREAKYHKELIFAHAEFDDSAATSIIILYKNIGSEVFAARREAFERLSHRHRPHHSYA